jgi:hypothetical protein
MGRLCTPAAIVIPTAGCVGDAEKVQGEEVRKAFRGDNVHTGHPLAGARAGGIPRAADSDQPAANGHFTNARRQRAEVAIASPYGASYSTASGFSQIAEHTGMTPATPPPARDFGGPAGWVVVVGASVLAAASALPYAGGWNDGSRLAAVESIADRLSLAIDDSIFVRVPADSDVPRSCPYPPEALDLRRGGSKDKLLIRGHFYSDKPPAISVLMAGLYRSLQAVGLYKAAERPDLFCRTLTLATSGVAYVLAVICMWRLGLSTGLRGCTALGWTASFALATVAPAYTRHVNNHILLLAVVAGLLLLLRGIGARGACPSTPWLRLALVGTLGGVAYNLDLAAGPVLVGCLMVYTVRCCRWRGAAAVLAAALPWLAAHHALNYLIGGVWKPVNTVAEYAAWPDSPFSEENLTGFWQHQPARLVIYALALLFGKHGFVGHNLALFLAPAAVVHLVRRPVPERAEAALGLAWCAGTWLMYAAFSNNYGGACCSVRWFVPFLAPAYLGLGLYLRERPASSADFTVLSMWGGVLAAVMWYYGPWIPHMVPGFWAIQAAALAGCIGIRWWRGRGDAGEEGGTIRYAPRSTAA